MTLSVEWTEKALWDLRRNASVDAKRILAKTDSVAQDPVENLDRLANSRLYKYRVGGYRVIVDVVRDRQVMPVVKVRKRSRAYA